MNAFEQVANQLVHDSDDPVGEVECLLKTCYMGKEEGGIYEQYEDIIKITEKKYGKCEPIGRIK